MPEHFDCPSCGASLDNIDFTKPTAKCVYCGKTITIPENLRQANRSSHDIESASPLIIDASRYRNDKRSSAAGIIGCVLALVVVAIIGASIFLVFEATPGMTEMFSDMTTALAPAAITISSTHTPSPIAFQFGGKGKGNGKFEDPRTIALDGEGSIYVADYTSGRVQQFSEEGEFLYSFITQTRYKALPTFCLTADRNGIIYVCRDSSIQKINAETGKEVARLTIPGVYIYQKLTLMPDGTLVALSDDDMIFLSADGTLIRRIENFIYAISEQSQMGLDLAINGLGDIYVLSKRENAVYHFDKNGKYIDRFGQEGSRYGDFDTSATALAIDSVGNIYVADWDKINIFDSDGSYITAVKFGAGIVNEMEFNGQDELFAAMNTNVIYKFLLPAVERS